MPRASWGHGKRSIGVDEAARAPKYQEAKKRKRASKSDSAARAKESATRERGRGRVWVLCIAAPLSLPRSRFRALSLPLVLFPELSSSPVSHLQEGLRVLRVRECDEGKPPPFHHRDIGKKSELGRVLAQRLNRRPVRDAADEELARLLGLRVCFGVFINGREKERER